MDWGLFFSVIGAFTIVQIVKEFYLWLTGEVDCTSYFFHPGHSLFFQVTCQSRFRRKVKVQVCDFKGTPLTKEFKDFITFERQFQSITKTTNDIEKLIGNSTNGKGITIAFKYTRGSMKVIVWQMLPNAEFVRL